MESISRCLSQLSRLKGVFAKKLEILRLMNWSMILPRLLGDDGRLTAGDSSTMNGYLHNIGQTGTPRPLNTVESLVVDSWSNAGPMLSRDGEIENII
jgi:hypothetical protein